MDKALQDAQREWFLREYAHLISPWMFAPEEIARRNYSILAHNFNEAAK